MYSISNIALLISANLSFQVPLISIPQLDILFPFPVTDIQVLHQQIRQGVKTCADFADTEK